MKKVRFLPATIFAALLALLAVCIFALSGCSVNYFSGCSAQNSDNVPLVDPAYRFELEKYDVTYDISDDCSIQVTEIMDVFLYGILPRYTRKRRHTGKKRKGFQVGGRQSLLLL